MTGLAYRRPGAIGMTRVRLTRRRRRVLLALLTGATNLSGYPLCQSAQVGSGTVYTLLDHLETAGWVIGDWEVLPDGSDRPRRRFYRLTGEGRTAAAAALKLEIQP